MKLGDKVIASGSIGIIVEKYNGTRGDYETGWDWEVAFITNPPLNCWIDCYNEKDLKLYKWNNYPKTFIEKLKLFFNFTKLGASE